MISASLLLIHLTRSVLLKHKGLHLMMTAREVQMDSRCFKVPSVCLDLSGCCTVNISRA